MEFFKFKRTKHIYDAGGNGVTRDDLIMTKKEADSFLKGNEFVIEEKVDGANIGISIDNNYKIKVQNRSKFVNSTTHKQFSTLDAWLEKNSEDLYEILSPPGKFILFGEWLLAKHSVHYTRLPSYFLAFDIFDIENKKFLSVAERNDKLKDTSISRVHTICQEDNVSKKRVSQFFMVFSLTNVNFMHLSTLFFNVKHEIGINLVLMQIAKA